MKIRDEIDIYVTYNPNVVPKRARIVYEVEIGDKRVFGDTDVTIMNVLYQGVEIGGFVYDSARDKYMIDGGRYHFMKSAVEYVFDRHIINRAEPRVVSRIMANIGEGERI